MSAIKLFIFCVCIASFSCTNKIQLLSTHKVDHTGLSYMGSGERSVQLKLNHSSALISEETTLAAQVSLPFKYNHPLIYKWKLGQNIILIEGDLTGQIILSDIDSVEKISIKIKNFKNQDSRFVRFEIVGTDPKNRVYSDGLISSSEKKSFENTVQKIEKIQKVEKKINAEM